MSLQATPMIKQYLEIKGDFKDSILFFRLGDFYEMFFEDAVEASKILNITLTSRNKGEPNSIPLCGVPWHSADQYIAKLLKAGRKIAICEQIEDPKQAKGVVKREVVRVITPGVVHSGLDDRSYNLLVSIYIEGEDIGIARVDASTGFFEAGTLNSETELNSEISRLYPSELLVFKENTYVPSNLNSKCLVSTLSNNYYSLDGMSAISGVDKLSPASKKAASAVVNYLDYTQKGFSNISRVNSYRSGKTLHLDGIVIRHLELLRTMVGNEKKGSLLWLMDKAKTAMGARLLGEWIVNPLSNINLINERLNAVEILVDKKTIRESISSELSNIRDIERLVSKCTAGIATPRDLRSLGDSLINLKNLKKHVEDEGGLLRKLSEKIVDPNNIGEKIVLTIVDAPPIHSRDGKIVSDGVDAEIDGLRNISNEGKGFLLNLEREEKEKTGIPIKIRYNRVFGYYIEVTKSYLDKVPDRYIRKQTLANAERYFTPKLKEFEEKVLNSEEKIKELENKIFVNLRNEISDIAGEILSAANAIAILDCINSFANSAVENNYCKPVIHEGLEIEIIEGRHPVVEKLLIEERFVPNDVKINGDDKRMMIITGPNMAGKSTVMRQVALMIIMAQMGSYVPARSAQIGLVDKIFTRVGAADALIKGQSTFMVEMSETALILKQATERSFIVIDEIGRGTSTFDGLAIAWAVAEDLANRVCSRTMFATHYHELTDLGETNGIKNMNIAVREWEGKVIFLRKLIPGPTSHSYGIQVGEMAGLPEGVVSRAKEVLEQLEELNELEINRLVLKGEKPQMSLFGNSKSHGELLKKLEEIDLSVITPIEALNLLDQLKKLVN